jgi:hypothetical protein
VAYTISCWPLTRETQVQSRLLSLGFVVDKVLLGKGFLEYFNFTVTIIPSMFHTHSFSHYQYYLTLNVVSVTIKRSVLFCGQNIYIYRHLNQVTKKIFGLESACPQWLLGTIFFMPSKFITFLINDNMIATKRIATPSCLVMERIIAILNFKYSF